MIDTDLCCLELKVFCGDCDNQMWRTGIFHNCMQCGTKVSLKNPKIETKEV